MERESVSRVQVATQLLLGVLSKKGINIGKRRQRTKGEIEVELAERLFESIQALELVSSSSLKHRGQTSLDLRVSKSRVTPKSLLQKILSKKLPPRPRQAEVNLSDIIGLTLEFAGALALRGFVGVSEGRTLERFKREVEWVLHEYGYVLPHSRLCSCPFLVAWTEYPLWITLARVDGLSENAANYIRRDQRRRSGALGCSGYACATGREQASLSLSA